MKAVDSGSRYLNNIGYTVEEKMEFIKDYEFVSAYQNSSYPCYSIEKILEPLVANCIPVYWGNPIIDIDFDSKCFINANDFDNYDVLIKQIMEINENDELAYRMLMSKNVMGISGKHLKTSEELNLFLDKIFNKKKKLPIAKNKFTCRFRLYINVVRKLRQIQIKFFFTNA